MSKELSAPLRDIVRRAAENRVEGPASRIRARFEGASDNILVVADCSGSMDEPIGALTLSKYEHLKLALSDVLRHHPKIRIIAFSYMAKEVTPDLLPHPCGGTDLAGALTYAAKFTPRKTVVISDGLPDDERAALEAAQTLTGSIDTIYCGPDGHPALDFLRQLSRDTGGTSVQWDGYREISTMIRGLLPAPSSLEPQTKKRPWWRF